MKTVNVVIIDSGIGKDQNNLCKSTQSFVGADNSVEDKVGHGCAVLYLIDKYCKANIESIKIFDQDEEINEDILIDTFHRLLLQDHIDVINLSMGVTTCERFDEFENICKELANKGTIIISAFDNDGAMSYPAAFECVIGVDSSHRCKLVREFEFVESDIINIRGFGGLQRLPLPTGEFAFLSGTSFVAPYITAKVVNLIQNGFSSKEDILNELKKEAISIYPNDLYEKPKEILTINNALIFPFNKEVHSLITFTSLLTFHIYKICDLKHMRTVGKRVSDLLKHKLDTDYIIENIEQIDWNDDFDTVILGHLNEINGTLHEDITLKILSKCVEHNKQLYSFDSLASYTDLYTGCSDRIQYPEINKRNVPKNHFGKMYQVHCPVLAVFGTSSRQGKFTLQLKLRDQFLQHGYKVAQLGTEPSAKLFGMDEVYPMGYNGNVYVNGYDEIATINYLIKNMVKEDTDIVLVGSQSQTVAYSSHNMSLFPISTVNFLLGTQPDIILLCVNVYDDDAYLQRTINYLEGMIDSKVIALMVSPVLRTLTMSTLNRSTEIASKETINKFCIHLNERFHRQCFIMDIEEDASDIYDYCVETLTHPID